MSELYYISIAVHNYLIEQNLSESSSMARSVLRRPTSERIAEPFLLLLPL